MRLSLITYCFFFITSCASVQQSTIVQQQLHPYDGLLNMEYQIRYENNQCFLLINTTSSNLNVVYNCYTDDSKQVVLYAFESDFKSVYNQLIRIRIDVNQAQFYLELECTDADKLQQFSDALYVSRLHTDKQHIYFNNQDNQPQLNYFVSPEKTVKLKHSTKATKHLFVKYYGIIDEYSRAPNENDVDLFDFDAYQSISTVPTNSKIQFKLCGSYYIQTDTNSKEGVFVVSTYPDYPYALTADSRINCLQYLLSNENYRKIQSADAPKNAFDKFWSGRKQNILKRGAYRRRLVSIYYDRIEFSNRFFTSCKHGHQTDQGMIYIIYGAPDLVKKLNNKEIWVYQTTTNSNPIEFVFLQKHNLYYLNRLDDLTVPYNNVLRNWQFGNIDLN